MFLIRPQKSYLRQFDYLTGSLEIEIVLPTGGFYYGIFEDNSNLYVNDALGGVYKVDINSPYTVTLLQNIGQNGVSGASQVPNCNNVSLIQNLCPIIYTTSENFCLFDNTGYCASFYTKNYVWNPITNIQQEILLTDDVASVDISSTPNKLWKNYTQLISNQFVMFIKEWDLTGYPPYSTTFNRTLLYPSGLNPNGSPGLCAKNNNTLVIITSVVGGGSLSVYEISIPNAPATQTTSTIKFNLINGIINCGDYMLTSKDDGSVDKLILVGNKQPLVDGGLNTFYVQQYNYNTGVLEVETPPITVNNQAAAGISQFNNDIFLFFIGTSQNTSIFGNVLKLDKTSPYALTTVSNSNVAGGANSFVSCSKGKLIGPPPIDTCGILVQSGVTDVNTGIPFTYIWNPILNTLNNHFLNIYLFLICLIDDFYW